MRTSSRATLADLTVMIPGWTGGYTRDRRSSGGGGGGGGGGSMAPVPTTWTGPRSTLTDLTIMLPSLTAMLTGWTGGYMLAQRSSGGGSMAPVPTTFARVYLCTEPLILCIINDVHWRMPWSVYVSVY